MFYSFGVLGGALIGAGVGLVLGIILQLIKKVKSTKNKDKIDVVDGVRYTKSSDVNNVSFNTKDFVLKRNQEYVVEKNGQLMPGKYIMLTTDENTKEFNMRVDGFVKNYGHNDSIILVEGDKVCAVSMSVILR